jgi:hypothetical protein
VEPKSRRVDIEDVSNLGLSRAWHKDEDVVEESGFNPTHTSRPALGPGGGRTIHPHGSQGKHK